MKINNEKTEGVILNSKDAKITFSKSAPESDKLDEILEQNRDQIMHTAKKNSIKLTGQSSI